MDVVGFVDGVIHGHLCGWVYHPATPRHRLTVAVRDRSGRRRVALADRYRADVQRCGHGDGHYGFSLLTGGLDDTSAVEVTAHGATTQLPIAYGDDLTIPPHIFTSGPYTLCADRGATAHFVSGWAVDVRFPLRRRTLRLLSGDHVVGQQRATLYRREVANAVCDGYYGFLFPCPLRSLTAPVLQDVETGALFPFQV